MNHALVAFGRRRIDEAFQERETDAADTAGIQRFEFVERDVEIDHRHAPRFVSGSLNPVERGRIVGAVATRLNDHVARKTEKIA